MAYCERIGKYSASNYTGAVCLSVFGISNADEGSFYGTGSRRKSLLLLNKIQYRFVSPKQFDVIAFQIKDSDELQIKRIIACPGDCISIKEGMIYINGTLCEQANEYSKDLIYAGTASDELTVGENEYFVLGDNAVYSEDSRSEDIGMVSKDQIVGKVWFVGESFLSFHLL